MRNPKLYTVIFRIDLFDPSHRSDRFIIDPEGCNQKYIFEILDNIDVSRGSINEIEIFDAKLTDIINNNKDLLKAYISNEPVPVPINVESISNIQLDTIDEYLSSPGAMERIIEMLRRN